MVSKINLVNKLRLQWWMHTLITSLFFIVLAFFFLFVIEDYLNEKQLIDMSQIVAMNDSIQGLPEQVQTYSTDESPQTWLKQLNAVELNTPIEVSDIYGNNYHVLRTKHNSNKETFVIALDTSRTFSVGDNSDKLLILIFPWVIIFLLAASILAKKFSQKIESHFNALLSKINNADSPQRLEEFAAHQPIEELSQFAKLFAQTWQQKIDILVREKQGLEYLSHELRTPIQSSLATLELLALKTKNEKTIARLFRSLNRMTRLSNCVLYLMESEKQPALREINVFEISRQLVDELEPLAKVKGQSIVLEKNVSTSFLATQEIIETLISILLTNALQHSNSSPINIKLSQNQFTIENTITLCEEVKEKNTQSFGIGLSIAQRLADKLNLKLNFVVDDMHGIATLSGK